MGPREAALAARLVKAKTVFPMHWGTFPALTGRPAAVAELLKGTEIHVLDVEPGQKVDW